MLGAYGRNKQRADMATLKLAAREVLGEERRRRMAVNWPWSLAALVLLGAGAIGWGVSQMDSKASIPNYSAATVVEPVITEPSSEVPAQVEKLPDKPAKVDIEAGAKAETNLSWLLPPGEGNAVLWSLVSDLPLPEDLCSPQSETIACIESCADTWDELLVIQRPLLLEMVTSEKFAATTVLLGIEGREAWVARDGGVSRIKLAELGPLWNGRYRYLWHPPRGFERPLAEGDSSPAVAEVARLFARLDGQTKTLAGERFNAALKQRVILFQESHGLEADGLVGVQTLLKLNEALGIDPSASQARAVLASRA
jgi:general secretion pathway protein A